jgi:hypothetical protein
MVFVNQSQTLQTAQFQPKPLTAVLALASIIQTEMVHVQFLYQFQELFHASPMTQLMQLKDV